MQGPFQEREAGLFQLERQLQEDFLREYKAQVAAVEPIIIQRGFQVGQAIRSSFSHGMKTTTTYEDAYESAGLVLFENESTKQILQLVDPLIAPVLSPFVEGVKRPLNDALNDIKRDIGTAWILSTTATLVTGIIVGAYIERRRRE